MNSLQQSIINTYHYSRFFKADLTFDQLHHWLITPHHVSRKRLKTALEKLPKINKHISQEPTSSTLKKQQISHQKISQAKPILKLLSLIPTIRLIAITGSLAVDNSTPTDDTDILIVTYKNTLWLTRPLIILILTLLGKKRPPQSNNSHPHSLCVNLWLDTHALTIPPQKRNLYTAHEVLQIKPIFNKQNTYQQLINHNLWVSEYLANAYPKNLDNSPLQEPLFIKFLAPFNLLFFLTQYLYMKPKITNEFITLHEAYFHPHQYNHKITRYLKRSQ